MLSILTVMTLLTFDSTAINNNPHRLLNLTWVILDAQNQLLNSSSNYTTWPWFPTLYFDFAEMLVGSHGFHHKTKCNPSPREVWNTGPGLYICPGYITDLSHIDRKIWWTPPYTTDYIKAGLGPDSNLPWSSCSNWACCGVRLNPTYVTFTQRGKQLPATDWQAGKRWGGRSYDNANSHPGSYFTIRLHIAPTYSPPIGRNKAIQSSFLAEPGMQVPHPLLQLLNSTFLFLNFSRSNLTNSCWLCLSAVPPFYEAAGSLQPFANQSTIPTCKWLNGTQTVNSVIGKGCCIGIVGNFSKYCNITPCLKGQWFLPGNDSVWACSTGLSPCVSGDVLISTKSFCIQVYLLPKLSYHNSADFLAETTSPHLYKHEVVTALTLSLLLGLGAAGASTGITALGVGNQQFHSLRADIDADLERIETSITHLQTSLTSLSEVVLQNRRGLDLLFLKEEGLCVALKEECCFYADHSGVVLDSMAQLRKRLLERKKEREARQGWFDTLLGPLLLLLLACLIGPCILSQLLRFLQTRLKHIEAMHLQTCNLSMEGFCKS
uniref:Uncharacterized protein n=1 Tax=Naja naja TaxID=35670 RepID=A0A8C6X0V9_NAJNA